MESTKMVLINLVEKRLVDTVGKVRAGQTESSIDIYTLSCVKQIASAKFLNNRGSPAQCSVMT